MSKFWPHLFVTERVDKQPLSFQLLYIQTGLKYSLWTHKEKELTLF